MNERICVSYSVAGEYKERGFRGETAESRAKELAKKLLRDPKVDDDGDRRVDAVSVFLTSLDGETTLGEFVFTDVDLAGWQFMDMDG